MPRQQAWPAHHQTVSTYKEDQNIVLQIFTGVILLNYLKITKVVLFMVKSVDLVPKEIFHNPYSVIVTISAVFAFNVKLFVIFAATARTAVRHLRSKVIKVFAKHHINFIMIKTAFAPGRHLW